MFNKRTGILTAFLAVALVITGLAGCGRGAAEPVAAVSSSPSESAASPDKSVQPSAKGPVNTVSPTVSAQVSPTASPTPSAADSQSPNPTPSQTTSAEKEYFGQWMVQKVQAYGPVGTYGKENAEKMVGQSLSFAADEATILTEEASNSPTTIQNPVYEETVITRDDFSFDYRRSFDDIGLRGDSVTSVHVSSPQAIGKCTLLIKDDNTIILLVGGTYFALTRVE